MKQCAFTLVELLVVIAIIAILAAILFPVFVQAKDAAKAAACLSNQRQSALAINMYLTDFGERLFFYASTHTPSKSRTGAVMPDATALNRSRWWNLLLPYVKNSGVFACPSDAKPSMSPDENGDLVIPRSYIASRPAEGLTSSQLYDANETVVLTEKRNDVTDSWIEVFLGDFNWDQATQTAPVAAPRHRLGLNCAFFDGHAKRYTLDQLVSSPDLTGCNLVHRYPVDDMCDQSVVGCTSTLPDNVCDTFTYP